MRKGGREGVPKDHLRAGSVANVAVCLCEVCQGLLEVGVYVCGALIGDDGLARAACAAASEFVLLYYESKYFCTTKPREFSQRPTKFHVMWLFASRSSAFLQYVCIYIHILYID